VAGVGNHYLARHHAGHDPHAAHGAFGQRGIDDGKPANVCWPGRHGAIMSEAGLILTKVGIRKYNRVGQGNHAAAGEGPAGLVADRNQIRIPPALAGLARRAQTFLLVRVHGVGRLVGACHR
jgi:hypothetical protein